VAQHLLVDTLQLTLVQLDAPGVRFDRAVRALLGELHDEEEVVPVGVETVDEFVLQVFAP
jgi:hypothetical protein